MAERINGQFAPGVSGNPSGRPKIVGVLRDLAREHTTAAIERLVELMNSKDEWVAVKAAKTLLDRGWGKPGQALAIDATITAAQPVQPITTDMTPQQAADAYFALLRRTEYPPGLQ